MRRLFPSAAVAVALAGCLPEPDADLQGPRVVSASLDVHAVEVPVAGALVVELSEDVDGASVHAGSVALLRWQRLGRCDLTPVCAKGSCAAGGCWGDPLGSGDLSALDRGEFSGDPEHEVAHALAVDGARITVEPARTLEPHTRYSLVLGGGVRDRSGAGLVDAGGFETRWRSDFVTGGEGSSGPIPRLSSPAAEADHVATNLLEVRTEFAVPVQRVPGSRLELGDPTSDARVGLVDPVWCEGWVEGFCLAWTIDGPLPANAHLQILGGALVDVEGRGLVLGFLEESFRTGEGPDSVPPVLEDAHVALRGPCIVARLWAREAVQVSLQVGGGATRASVEAGELELGVRVDEPGDGLARLSAHDLAGNVAGVEVQLDSAQLAQPVPALAITELLANPAGPEPHQEFVELANFGDAPIELDGLWLADLAWEQVAARLDEGEKPPGDALPAHTLAPDALALVVAAGYDAAQGSDEPPAPGVDLLRVDASLGQSGLKNAGEPLTLYRADPPALIASYGNFVDTSASAHSGRSVALVRPQACDVAASWASHPLGRATPGRLP